MRNSTAIKAFLASIAMLGMNPPLGHAQSLFFGMMTERSSEGYNPESLREITDRQAAEKFGAIDLNHDGAVTREEFKAAYADLFPDDTTAKLADKRFRMFDMKKIGKISQPEFIASRNELIENSYVANVPDDVEEERSANMVSPAAGGPSD